MDSGVSNHEVFSLINGLEDIEIGEIIKNNTFQDMSIIIF
jgi:hypothetical protein